MEATGPQTVFIGYGVTGAPSAELATLAAYLNPAPSVKWAKGASTSPLSSAIPEGASVQVVYLPYSDASLIGLLVQAETVEGVTAAGKAAVAALKKAAQGVKEEEVAAAVAKAKFAAASATDGREGIVKAVGAQIFSGTASSSLAAFDAVNASAFTKVRSAVSMVEGKMLTILFPFLQAASSLVSAKPTYVAVGNVATLPYADELGL